MYERIAIPDKYLFRLPFRPQILLLKDYPIGTYLDGVAAKGEYSLYFSLLAGTWGGREQFARDCVHRQPVSHFLSVPVFLENFANSGRE